MTEPTRSRGPKKPLQLAGYTAPTIDVQEEPAPPSVSPEIASTLASNNGHSRTYGVADLIAGRPDPENDLVQLNVRQPRLVVQAVDAVSRTTRRPRSNIVRDALLEHLAANHPNILEEVRTALYGS